MVCRTQKTLNTLPNSISNICIRATRENKNNTLPNSISNVCTLATGGDKKQIKRPKDLLPSQMHAPPAPQMNALIRITGLEKKCCRKVEHTASYHPSHATDNVWFV